MNSLKRAIVSVSVILGIGILFIPNLTFAATLEVVKKYPTNDPFYEEQWYLDKINIRQAWKYTTGSSKIVIAVIDSGVDIDHPDLKDNIWINQNEQKDGIDNDRNGYIDDINGWDFIKNSSNPRPKLSKNNVNTESLDHGTIVAGIIAAKGNNNLGISGISWHSKIMPLRVLDSQGNGDISDIVEAVYYAINNKADIINLSFAGTKNDPRLEEAIKRAKDKNIMVVAAAGNEGFMNIDNQFLAYQKEYINGVNITTGNVDNDKQIEIITAPAKSYYPTIKIFDSQGTLESFFYAYDENFRGGVNVATGDIDGDGIDEIITGAGFTGGPQVRIFDSRGSVKGQFFAYDKNSRNGVTVATGDIDGDGIDEIITGAGFNEKPIIKIFDAQGNLQGQFFAYAEHFRGGVNVATGDTNGDGIDEIITGAGVTGGPHVRIFNTKGVVQGQFFAYAEHFRGGVNVATGKIVSEEISEIITGSGENIAPYIRIKSLNSKKTAVNLNKFSIYPICYTSDAGNLIGISSSDVDNRRSIFSNYGERCVDFTAPGEFFFGLKNTMNDLQNEYYGGYWSGTSFSAPVATGTIALIKSMDKTLTTDEIIDILIDSSDKSKLKEGESMYGNINVGRAIKLIKEGRQL